jgi:hypothetical protein
MRLWAGEGFLGLVGKQEWPGAWGGGTCQNCGLFFFFFSGVGGQLSRGEPGDPALGCHVLGVGRIAF